MVRTANPTGVQMDAHERKVYDTLLALGARGLEHGKTADDVMKAGKLPKGQMLGWLHSLEAKGFVKRKHGDKAARYFVPE